MRPISNVVDVTNYVMLALGNPLHAFDLKTLAGGKIVVRRAEPGETIRTLDGVDRKLEESDLVIADAERAVAIAGIMGGEETEIGEETTDVLLEAANFEPTGLYRTSERLRLRTEGSNRWEKGVDPYLAEQAAKLATQLLVETAGAEWIGHVDVKGELPERPVIPFRPERADELIGLATPSEEQIRWLERLGFESRDGEVVAPTFRSRDVTRESTSSRKWPASGSRMSRSRFPTRREMFGAFTPLQRLRRRVEDVLSGLGLAETYTPSLRSEDPTRTRSASRSRSRSSSRCFAHACSRASSTPRAATSSSGRRRALRDRPRLPPGRRASRRAHPCRGHPRRRLRPGEGLVETLYAALNAEPAFERADDPLLHPGKTARTRAGIVGELMPGALEGRWAAFELELAELLDEAREP